jgi:nuclear transport factor 2 (NTF2) superfamily protein
VTVDGEELKSFAESYTAAWNSGNPASVAAHYAPSGSLAINGAPPDVGREALTAVAASFFEALPDMKLYLRDLVVEDDRIEYHWTFTGTNTGPGGTGNSVRVDGFESWTLDENGLIARSIGTFDAEEYARQLAEGV